MKRYLMVSAIVAALALPAEALGSAAYSGPVGDGSNNAGVELSVVFRNHHPKRVKAFNWFNVPIPTHCTDSANFPVDMPVHLVNGQRRFHGHHSIPETTHEAWIHGRFRHHNKKVVGTLRIKGAGFSGGCLNADTGALGYVAHKG